jgi:hypothetical protein
MGLLDVLNGMQNGPGGQRAPSGGTGGGGMSPMTMALLGLLAYKAYKGSGLGGVLGGSQPAPAGAGRTTSYDRAPSRRRESRQSGRRRTW